MKMSVKRLWSALNGIVGIYKPPEMSVSSLKRFIVKAVCSDAKESIIPSPRPLIRLPIVEPHPKTGALVVVGYREQEDYLCNPLVSGDVIRSEDVRVEEVSPMETSSSGVCLIALNEACDDIPSIMARSLVSHYRIEGLLGRETVRNEMKTRVKQRVDYSSVTRHKMMKLLSKIQSEYRKTAFEAANVDLQSEEAFELARKGTPRAQLPGVQIVYNIELDSFKPPYFALHVQIVGETDMFLRDFIHEIGLSLGTTASCVRLQRRSFGPITSDHCLLDKQISMMNIIRNIDICRKLLNVKEDSKLVTNSPNLPSIEKQMVDGVGYSSIGKDFDAMRPSWPRNYD